MTDRRKVLTVLGARPQFIKAAPLSRAFARTPSVTEMLVHTGQHFDANMSDVFFEELSIPKPARNLDIHGGSHGEMTGRMLSALEAVMLAERPDGVLVYGDTNSTLAGALAAAKLHTPVFHVEAGLRSFNRAMPEEINRVAADHMSDLLFCPTRQAVTNLDREGITRGVHLVGDVMYDAALHAREAAGARGAFLAKLGVQPGKFAICTIHRAENTDDGARLACLLDYVSRDCGAEAIVWPVHPRTRAVMTRTNVEVPLSIKLTEPLGYFDLQGLLANACAVYTDSGGVQKEAYFHGVPCVTLRSETEWVETVEAGWNRLWTEPAYKPRRPIEDYGDGRAAERIVAAVSEFLALRTPSKRA